MSALSISKMRDGTSVLFADDPVELQKYEIFEYFIEKLYKVMSDLIVNFWRQNQAWQFFLHVIFLHVIKMIENECYILKIICLYLYL